MEKLLDKYRKEFMIATLGNYLDEEDKEYSLEYFKWEWKEFKKDIAHAVNYYEEIVGHITEEGLMILIVTKWCLGCCVKEYINKVKLFELCKKMIKEKEVEDEKR